MLSYVYSNKNFHQRGVNIMTYKMPNFQMKIDENEKFSSMGGALIIPAIFEKFDLRNVINEHIGARKDNGAIKYTDSSYIESLVTMQILGGSTVDDMHFIRKDGILADMLGGIPSKSSIHNYLNRFVDVEEEQKRGQGKAFVPESNEHLKGFDKVTQHLLEHAPCVQGIETITLDQDDTFITTEVTGALFNYKSERAFDVSCQGSSFCFISQMRPARLQNGLAAFTEKSKRPALYFISYFAL